MRPRYTSVGARSANEGSGTGGQFLDQSSRAYPAAKTTLPLLLSIRIDAHRSKWALSGSNPPQQHEPAR